MKSLNSLIDAVLDGGTILGGVGGGGGGGPFLGGVEDVEGIEGGVLGGGGGVLGGEDEEDDDDADALPFFIAANMASPICAAVGDGGRLFIIARISAAVAGWGKPVIIP